MKPQKYLMYIIVLLITILATESLGTDDNWYTVTRIIDGDTLQIRYKGRTERVRLFGIDAPEKGEYGYFKAAALLEELCYGKKVRLEFPTADKRDRFGRLLAKVYLHNGMMVNEILYRKKVVQLYRKSPLF